MIFNVLMGVQPKDVIIPDFAIIMLLTKKIFQVSFGLI